MKRVTAKIQVALILLSIPTTSHALSRFLPPSHLLNASQSTVELTHNFWRERVQKRPDEAMSALRFARSALQLAREKGKDELYQDAYRALAPSTSTLRSPSLKRASQATLTEALLAQHKFQEALTIISSELSSTPDDIEWRYLKVDALLGLGELADAEQVLQTSLDADNESFPYLTRAATLAELSGRLSEARELLRSALLNDDPLNHTVYGFEEHSLRIAAWLRVRIGGVLLKEKRFDIARRWFEKALLIKPNYYLAQEHLAEVLEHEGGSAPLKQAHILLEAATHTSKNPALLLRKAAVEKELGLPWQPTIAAAKALNESALSTLPVSMVAKDAVQFELALADFLGSPLSATRVRQLQRLSAQNLAARPKDKASLALDKQLALLKMS